MPRDLQPQWSNLFSLTTTEMYWKLWGTSIPFLAVHAYALLAFADWAPLIPIDNNWLDLLGIPYQAALFLPLCSLVIFTILHRADQHFAGVRGLKGRSQRDHAAHREYAPSAISRLSIHSGLGIGVIAAARTAVASGTPVQTEVLKWAIFMLGTAVLFGMFAVLCYAHSDRWTTNSDPKLVPAEKDSQLRTKRGLLGKTSLFDQLSFYALTTGLIWTVALYNPWLSVASNFVLGGLLYWYYFDFRKERGLSNIFAFNGKNLEDLAKAKQADKTTPPAGGVKPEVVKWQEEMTAAAEQWIAEFAAKYGEG